MVEEMVDIPPDQADDKSLCWTGCPPVHPIWSGIPMTCPNWISSRFRPCLPSNSPPEIRRRFPRLWKLKRSRPLPRRPPPASPPAPAPAVDPRETESEDWDDDVPPPPPLPDDWYLMEPPSDYRMDGPVLSGSLLPLAVSPEIDPRSDARQLPRPFHRPKRPPKGRPPRRFLCMLPAFLPRWVSNRCRISSRRLACKR